MSNLVGKVVVYNGGTESVYGCSSPSALICGKRYLVTSECVSGWQTNVELKGVTGEFNSVWFDEVIYNKKEWLAEVTLYNSPVLLTGKRISLLRLHEDTGAFEAVTTSEIKSVKKVYGNIYLIETKNNVYVTKVNLRTGC